MNISGWKWQEALLDMWLDDKHWLKYDEYDGYDITEWLVVQVVPEEVVPEEMEREPDMERN